MFKKLRPTISILLLLFVLAIATDYILDHRALLHQLAHTSLLVILLVFILYILMFMALMLILSASLRICRVNLRLPENAKLNAHSLFINFFVPGQGGPVYRGFYLYKRHRLLVKNYIIVTFLYYVFYAIISAFLLLIGIRPWWQLVIIILLIAAAGIFITDKYANHLKLKKRTLNLTTSTVTYLFLATALQTVIQIAIYTIELHSITNSHIAFMQIITYTGVANLALFVALTPGAIGIRESFLIISERLHHISSANIIIANIIDRSVYLMFLLLLLLITILLYINDKFHFKQLPSLLKQSLNINHPTSLSTESQSLTKH